MSFFIKVTSGSFPLELGKGKRDNNVHTVLVSRLQKRHKINVLQHKKDKERESQ